MRTALRALGNPQILFYALPWLMILLTLGTIAQRDLGLFEAQKIFFSSWILWLGPLPLPGAYTTLAIITLCLLVKFLFFSAWTLQQSGTILTHLGVLILLIGGGVTAFSQKEGFIAIKEGSSAAALSDYHTRVLRITKDDAMLAELDFSDLGKGDVLPDLPFAAKIESLCANCRPAPVKNTEGRMGLAREITLISAALEKDAETNLSGLTLSITGTKSDGVYVTMEEIPQTPKIAADNSTYEFSVVRAQRALPFSVYLKDFTKEMYPGTNMARAFSSDVEIRDGNMVWPATIRMNEPLRYKGYTLYQASFSLRPDGEYTVLSAVENKGRAFPYIASAVIFLGLLLHLLLRLRRGNP